MKKRRIRFRFILFLFIICLLVACASLYLFTGSLPMPTFIDKKPLTNTFIPTTKFIPLSTGYVAVNDEITRYDKKNNPILIDDLPESFLNFNSLTIIDSYLIIDHQSIYEIIDNHDPLFVHTLTEEKLTIVNVLQLLDGLLLTTYDGVSTYSLSLFSNDQLTQIDLPSHSFLIKTAAENKTNNFSTLCFTDEGPFVGTTIINYENNELIGEIVLHDTFYYDIMRFNHTIILVGTSDIACYNIESGLELWHYSFATPSSLNYASGEFGAFIASSDAVFNNQSLLLVDSDGVPVSVTFNKPIFLVDNTSTGYLFTTTDTLMQVTNEFEIKSISMLASPPVTLQYNPYLRCAYVLSSSGDFTVSYIK